MERKQAGIRTWKATRKDLLLRNGFVSKTIKWLTPILKEKE